MPAFRSRLVEFLAFATTTVASAQAPQALTLEKVLAAGNQLTGAVPRVLWLPAGHAATVVHAGDEGAEAIFAIADGKVLDEPLLTAAQVAAALDAAGLSAPAGEPLRLPPARWLDATTLRLEVPRAIAHLRLGEERAKAVLTWPAEGETSHAVAPGDGHVAFVRHHQLWLAGAGGRLRQITFDGSADVVYGGAAHRAEFGIDRGLFWSDDGRFLAFYREDQRAIAAYPYQDLVAMPPAPRSGRYPMAGDDHAKVRIGVLDTQDLGLCWLEHDPAEDVYWTNVTFGPDDTLSVARVARSQDRLELVRYEARSGKRLGTLLTEQDAEWVEPEHGPMFLPDGRFLWWSQRSGHRHLWLHAPDGKVLGEVTKGAFDVQRLVRALPDGKVWFQASGEDPRQLHLFVADVGTGESRQVTRERGTHRAELSPDGQVAYVVSSNLETPPHARLLGPGENQVVALPPARNPLRAFALPTQRMFQVKAEDGTVLYGHVALPPDLVEGQKRPVLLYVYGGPHVQLVTDQWLGGAPPWLQAFAAEGYVVCRLDNRGTPNRGTEFEQAVHRRLGVLEVQDQLRAVEWLKAQPFVDPARIAVHGWSYGGYMTLRLMTLAEGAFACGVSGAPVTEWRLYETGYTERYMDLPSENGEGYDASSVLPFVEKLQRPVLVVHGSDDDTVVWAHTLLLLRKCVDAGKVVDYFVYPGQKHGLVAGDRAHFLRYLKGYLDRHLQPR